MLDGLFVTGTDTNVGKTVAAAAFMHRYRDDGRWRYWKPIQTGAEQDDDTSTVQVLGACSDSEVWPDCIRLTHPVSPHLAAELSQTRISIAELDGYIERMPRSHRWLIEGAGGVLVPINESELMIDFIVHLKMPVLVVARSTLGTINHTLLTIEALLGRKLAVAGVVMVGESNQSNRNAIEEYGGVKVVGEMPLFPELKPDVLRLWAKTHFDTEGMLNSQQR